MGWDLACRDHGCFWCTHKTWSIFPCSFLFLFSAFCDSLISSVFCKNDIIHEEMQGGRGANVKVFGTCSEREEERSAIKFFLVWSCCWLSASDTELNAPLMCWPHKQHSPPLSTLANCLMMICRNGCIWSLAFAWWSQPNADVMLANDKKHDNGGASPSRIVIPI